MSSWTRRGLPHEELTKAQSDCLIRCDPSDGMNGFFIALLMKKRNDTTCNYGDNHPNENKYSDDCIISSRNSNDNIGRNSQITMSTELTRNDPVISDSDNLTLLSDNNDLSSNVSLHSNVINKEFSLDRKRYIRPARSNEKSIRKANGKISYWMPVSKKLKCF